MTSLRLVNRSDEIESGPDRVPAYRATFSAVLLRTAPVTNYGQCSSALARLRR